MRYLKASKIRPVCLLILMTLSCLAVLSTPALGQGTISTILSGSRYRGVLADGNGNVYVADYDTSRVLKISPVGAVTVVAGNGQIGFSGDGGPATSASFTFPWNMDLDATGNLYITDGENWRVRKVDVTGIITTIAGNGIRGFSGDLGPATAASIGGSASARLDAQGNLYIADAGNNRIRKVDTQGIIRTIAGNGVAASAGDGGQAAIASLNGPIDLVITPNGQIYIAEISGHRVRRIGTNGIITTVAGTGVPGSSGDGGPAAVAQLNSPIGLALDPDGNLYISEHDGHRVRKVDTAGIISTVAGTGVVGFSGDGGPATQAQLNDPESIAVDPAGTTLYIADTTSGSAKSRFLSLHRFQVCFRSH